MTKKHRKKILFIFTACQNEVFFYTYNHVRMSHIDCIKSITQQYEIVIV